MQLGKFLFVGKSKRKVKDPAWVRDKSQSLCLMLCEETQCVVKCLSFQPHKPGSSLFWEPIFHTESSYQYYNLLWLQPSSVRSHPLRLWLACAPTMPAQPKPLRKLWFECFFPLSDQHNSQHAVFAAKDLLKPGRVVGDLAVAG